MIVLRVFVYSVLCSVCFGASSAWSQIQSEVVAVADAAVGRVVVQYDGGWGTGSGFVLAPLQGEDGYFFLTNHHVIDGGTGAFVGFKEGNRIYKYDVQVAFASFEKDMAILKITPQESFGHTPNILAVRVGTINKGEQVAAVGFPGTSDVSNDSGNELAFFETTLTQGAVSKVSPGKTQRNRGTQEIVQHTAAINPGNSGGPMIDFCGSVLGINTAGVVLNSDGETPANGTFFAPSANSIVGFLQDSNVPFTRHKAGCDPDNPAIVSGGGGSDSTLLIILSVLCGGGALVIGGMYLVASRKRDDAEDTPSRGAAVVKPRGRSILAVTMAGQSAQFSAAQLQSGVTIGRASENTLTVTDRNLSRRHASLSLQGRKMMLTDLGSSNGTKVDGRRLKPNEPVQINTKSKVELGGIALVLKRP
ncbi:FHA domain-containing protein [Ruegeria sp. HKCCD4884]|uniref:trypsin-like peptidase domain-containing protein n=1 Tax=Ruegeria sp. HKCCD4884 TaxID=2683022 RepID=UPI0014911A2D|nr:trypsin-like peptidase domain-containing protein [Ruegeria sp. HKCCD4884]NOD93816.1 FHA domain-containing protein [Ruegeria sp. HKCCD4884]